MKVKLSTQRIDLLLENLSQKDIEVLYQLSNHSAAIGRLLSKHLEEYDEVLPAESIDEVLAGFFGVVRGLRMRKD